MFRFDFGPNPKLSGSLRVRATLAERLGDPESVSRLSRKQQVSSTIRAFEREGISGENLGRHARAPQSGRLPIATDAWQPAPGRTIDRLLTACYWPPTAAPHASRPMLAAQYRPPNTGRLLLAVYPWPHILLASYAWPSTTPTTHYSPPANPLRASGRPHAADRSISCRYDPRSRDAQTHPRRRPYKRATAWRGSVGGRPGPDDWVHPNGLAQLVVAGVAQRHTPHVVGLSSDHRPQRLHGRQTMGRNRSSPTRPNEANFGPKLVNLGLSFGRTNSGPNLSPPGGRRSIPGKFWVEWAIPGRALSTLAKFGPPHRRFRHKSARRFGPSLPQCWVDACKGPLS